MSWTAPLPGGAPITGYVVRVQPGGATLAVPGNQLSADVTGLQNGVGYTFTVEAVNAIGTGPASAPSGVVYPTPARSIVSDDFDTGVLNPAVWRFENPVGDATLQMDGTHAVIDVPTGSSHDLWTNSNLAPRLLQTVKNENFGIEAKWNTVVRNTSSMQGLIIQESPQRLLRIDFLYADPTLAGGPQRLFAASYVNGVATQIMNSPIFTDGRFLRVSRTGNRFDVFWSAEGTSWATGGSFDFPMTVTSVGAFAANHDVTDATKSPALASGLDYFFNMASPIDPEDPGLDTVAPTMSPATVTPSETAAVVEWTTNELAAGRVQYGLTLAYELGTTPSGPVGYRHRVVVPGLTASQTYQLRVRAKDVTGNESAPQNLTVTTLAPGTGASTITLFQGDNQTFWRNGNPQRWVNLLGNVSDPDGIASLSYRINGEATWRPLTVGKDDRRLVRPGDFNADLLNSDLVVGANSVEFRVVDQLGSVATKTITVTTYARETWPLPYDIHWGGVSNLQDVAQPVDGKWAVTPQGLHIEDTGYDRLVAVGDMEWTDYEVTVPVKVNSVDFGGYAAPSYGPGIGLALRWDGHYKWDDRQPNWGYQPLGSIGWYRWDPNGSQRLSLTNGAGNTAASDSSGFQVVPGNTYWYKMRVETIADGVRYTLTVWKDGLTPATGVTISTIAPSDSMQRGSALLLAHHVDATFGDVAIRPINPSTAPVITPSGGTFSGAVPVSISSPDPVAAIHYTLDGSEPTSSSPIYTGPFNLTINAEVRAVAIRSDDISTTTSQLFTVTSPTIRSDDFHGAQLDTSVWTLIRPQAAQQAWTDGTNFHASVPAGVSSDLYTDALLAPRLIQGAPDSDFEIETKIDAVPSQSVQFSGLIAQQDARNFVRADVYRSGAQTRLFAGTIIGSKGAGKLDVAISPVPSSVYLRLARAGNVWTVKWSSDGTNWTTAGTFTHSMQVTGVGMHTASTGSTPASVPAYTSSFDYFFNTAAPISPEDDGPTPDTAPYVDGGPNRVVTLPAGASLDGTVTDDGATTVAWSQLSGPATANILTPTAVDTDVSLPAPGTYHFLITVTDGTHLVVDTVMVTVNPNPSSPTVFAGPDKLTITGQPVALVGTASDDGLPNPLQLTWSKVSGPGSVVFSTPNAVNTTATITQAGTYVLRLTADDGQSQSADNVTVRVADDRVQGALALYDFQEGSGTIVHDTSESGAPVDLDIVAPQTDDYRWVTGGGLALEEASRVVSSTPITKVNDAVKASNEITVEAWVRPANTTQFGPARIASISSSSSQRNVTLGQGESSVSSSSQYSTRMRATGTSTNGVPSLLTPSGSAKLSLQQVVYTRSADGTARIYVDGVLKASGTATGNLSTWDSSMKLVLGNELGDARAWLGELHLVAFYAKALTAGEIGTNLAHGPTLLPGSNTRPSVDAGVDQLVRLPNTVSLDGTVTDDGRPNPPASTTTNWSVVSGPGPVTFANAAAVDTTATFTATGSYVLKLAATDGAKSNEDLVNIEIRPQPVAPGIAAQPQNAAVTVGQRATFTVGTTGTDLVYQWRRNGVDVPGANAASYSPPPALITDDGALFSVRISNELNTVTSGNAVLTVRGGGRVFTGLVGYYQLDENGGTTVGDTSGSGTPLNLTIADPSKVTWINGGLRINSATTISSSGPATKVISAAKSSNETTFEAWVKPSNTTQNTARMVSLSSDPNTRNAELNQTTTNFDGRLRTSNNSGWSMSGAGASTNSLKHVVMTRTADGTARLFVNGVQVNTTTWAGTFATWNDAMKLVLGNVATGDRPWLGELHEVGIYDRALSTAEVQQNFSAGAAPSPSTNTSPVVSAGDDQAITLPSTASIAGTINDDGLPLVPGAVTATWTKVSGPGVVSFAPTNAASTTVTFSTAGTYVLRLTASDGAGSGSDDVTVTVAAAPTPPSITQQPAPATVAIGQPATFSVVAAGSAPLSYQWMRDSVDIPGATSASYTLPTAILADSGADFQVRVTNPVNTVTSVVATLTVQLAPPRVTDGIAALYEFSEGSGSVAADTAGAGAPANLTIADPSRVTWTTGGLRVDTSTKLSASNSDRINNAIRASNEVTVEGWITSANVNQWGPARVVSIAADPYTRNVELTQNLGSWTSRLRTSTNTSNSIDTPSGTADTTLHHVVTTRAANGTYTTYVDGVVKASGTASGNLSSWIGSAPLTLANVATGDRPWLGEFQLAAIYSRALSATEVTQNLNAGAFGTTAPTKPSIVNQPADRTVSPGETATFMVGAAGSTPLSYQWRRNSVAIGGANSASYTTPATQLSDDGAVYDVIVSNPQGNVTSATAALHVTEGSLRVTAGLQVLYEFSEGAGGNVADSSGVGTPADLAIDGPSTWVAGGLAVTGSATLTSLSGGTKIRGAVAATNAITVEAWVKPSTVSQFGARIASIAPNPYGRNFDLYQQGTVWEGRIRTSANASAATTSPASVATTGLQHVVYTRAADGTSTLWVDGVLRDTRTQTGTLGTWVAGMPLTIANVATGDRGWSGEIDLVAIYDRALSQAEIQQNLAAGA